MAKKFNVYKKDGTKVVTESESPVTITGLTQNTDYAKGDFTATAIEDGKPESERVDIPAFKTKVTTVPVTGVTIAPKTASVEVGATVQVTGTVAPANATNKAVSYESSDTTKATVNETGLVTGVAEGTATITVKTADGNKTDTSTITVTVPAG